MKLIKPSYEIVDIKPREIAIPDDMEIGPQMVKDELLDTAYRQIELAGRTCYKSTPKYTYFETVQSNGVSVKVQIDPIVDGEKAIKYAEERFNNGDKSIQRYSNSAKDFVNRMIASGHNAMLEFGTIYLRYEYNPSIEGSMEKVLAFYLKYQNSKYSKAVQAQPWPGMPDYGYAAVTTNLRVLVENDWLDDLAYISIPSQYHEKVIINWGDNSTDILTFSSFVNYKKSGEPYFDRSYNLNNSGSSTTFDREGAITLVK